MDELERLRRAFRLYPQDHPAVAPFRRRLHTCLAEAQAPAFWAFGVRPQRVLVEGEDLQLHPESPAARLTETLAHLGIVGVRITLPHGGKSLERLAALLAEAGDAPGEEERQQVLDAAHQLPGLTLTLLNARLLRSVSGQPPDGDTSHLMLELVQRLLAEDWLPLPSGVNFTEEGVATLAGVLEGTPHLPTLAARLFAHLAEVVRADPEEVPLRLAWARALLRELQGLLSPERWHLAIVVAAEHLPPEVFLREDQLESLAGELLAAVASLLETPWQPPVAVVDLVRQIAHALGDPDSPLPPQVVVRAQVLLPRLEQALHRPPTPPLPATAPVPTHWPQEEWAKELTNACADQALGLYFGRLLAEAMALWPHQEVAEAAAHRLATEFVSAFETGDFVAAERLSSMVAAQPFLDARQHAAAAAVRVAQDLLPSLDSQGAASVVAILAALGSEVLPHLLQALVESDHRTTREQLVKAILHHGSPAIPYVRRLLADPRWFAVRNGVFLLRRLEDRESLPELRRLADHPAPQVRSEVFKALAALADPSWLPLLLRHVDSPDPDRWRVALATAARIPHPELTAALVARLRQRWGLRLREPFTHELIRTLGELRDPAALPVLLEVTELRQWKYPFPVGPLRRQAAVAIALLPSPEARQIAHLLAHDHDREVAAAVRRALRSVPPRDKGGTP